MKLFESFGLEVKVMCLLSLVLVPYPLQTSFLFHSMSYFQSFVLIQSLPILLLLPRTFSNPLVWDGGLSEALYLCIWRIILYCFHLFIFLALQVKSEFYVA